MIRIRVGGQFPPGFKTLELKCQNGEFGRGEGHAPDVSLLMDYTGLPLTLKSDIVIAQSHLAVNSLRANVTYLSLKEQNSRDLFPSSRFCSCFLVVTILALAVCVAMTYVGAEGLDDCPGEPMIPKYLMGESRATSIIAK